MRNGALPPDGWSGLEGLLALRDRLHGWVRAAPGVGEALAFGSTERPDRPADDWSDLDLLFTVDDAGAWLDDLAWTEAIGPCWLRFVHPAPIPGFSVVQVLFAGGYDADLIPVDGAGLDALAGPGIAAEVIGPGARLIRGDGAGALALLAARTAAPVRPDVDAAAFEFTVSTFLHQACWATKRLRRGERWRAWDDHACYMRGHLRNMLEWQAIERGTNGVHGEGRRLERWLGEDMASALPSTVAAYDDEAIAAAIPRLVGVFGVAAREVAAARGFAYPDAAEAAVLAWIRARTASPPSGTR